MGKSILESSVSKYQLVEIIPSGNDWKNEWNALIDRSDEATIFHSLDFHEGISKKFRYFKICKGTQPKGGLLCQVLDEDIKSMEPHSAVIHDGIFVLSDFVDSKENSRVNSAKFDIYQSVVEQLPNFFHTIKFTFSPSLVDMRPFLWFNYGAEEKSKYSINVRYTSIIDCSRIEDNPDLSQNSFFKGLSESRRQEIRYAIKNNVIVRKSDDFTAFGRMYFDMSEKYDKNAAKNLADVERIFKNLTEKNKAHMLYAYDGSGQVVAAAFLGVHKNRAYYLYGVTEKSSRERYSGSYLLWQALIDQSKNGVQSIDLEGINSPQRGWFKISFGGDINSYYSVSYINKG